MRLNNPKPLNNASAKQLLAYSTMAAAGVAACSSLAHAEVVYTPVQTKIHSSFLIDLNHDGIDDFRIYSYDLSGQGEVDVFAARSNRIIGVNQKCGFENNDPSAAPLAAGAEIGEGKPFQALANCMAFSDSGLHNGPWFGIQNRYLGFAFMIEGKVHFGWARLSLGNFIFNQTAEITGYAYETSPNTPIIAGDEGNSASVTRNSGTLGALALGSSQF
jgi:hypothetical protein